MRTRRSTTLAMLATALLMAGCGGGGEEEPATEQPAATATPEATPESTTAPEEPTETAAADGEEIFSQQCSTCHVLQAANAEGRVGPDLDTLEPDAEQVERKVIAGGGGMPSFADQLTSEEIDAVSEYVAEVAGS